LCSQSVRHDRYGAPDTCRRRRGGRRCARTRSAENFKGYDFHDDTVEDGPVFRIVVKSDKLFGRGGRALWTYLLGPTPQDRSPSG
jgi:hypothetical protein